MSKTYFAYRLPHESEVHFVKGDIVLRNSITELFGRGIVICTFHNDLICQLENIEEIDPEDWKVHYSDRKNGTTSLETYRKAFEALKKEINSGRFEKVVLTKTKEVPTEKDPLTIFAQLNKNYLNTFNYYLSTPELGSWMGATPETLCEVKEEKVTAISLAGTKNADENWTDKEIEEQLYVTRFIKGVLTDLHCTKIHVDGPHNIQAGPVMHLYSEITGNLLSREIWRKVIEDLHPTPATCGIPAKTSKEFIKSIEQHDRSIYTGFIGVFTDEFKKCFVNLRCMELFPKKAVVMVGGGITSGSTLEKEWEETERKAQTLEQFL